MEKKIRLDSDKVLSFAKTKKRFSTDDVARKFSVGRQQAAAAIAILRLKSLLNKDPQGAGPDGSSRWILV
jgi:hypothetical protein